jgi:hypothetical protein
MFDLNPLDVLEQRELKTLPPHFSKVAVPFQLDNKIENWIKYKLKGRYCVLKTPSVDTQGNLKSIMVAGFEDQKELTYFMLACPHLRRN